ncbi:YfbU family protein [Leuconostoc suionicum]|uniref:YfbU family protein n=1 Tax=Leuconostoc suionicum TaxID=1511761 RepID=UPI0032DF718F
MKKLTEFERLSLYNQYTLLADIAKLQHDSSSEKNYNLTAEIFKNGYTAEYDMQDNALNDFYTDEMTITDEEQEEVGSLLSMYSYLTNNYNGAKKKFPNINEIRYVGYDDNTKVGARKNGYLNFIMSDKNQYNHVKKGFQKNEDSTNSHGYGAPRVSMLKKYLELHENEDFYNDSDKYVKEILEAK